MVPPPSEGKGRGDVFRFPLKSEDVIAAVLYSKLSLATGACAEVHFTAEFTSSVRRDFCRELGLVDMADNDNFSYLGGLGLTKKRVCVHGCVYGRQL